MDEKIAIFGLVCIPIFEGSISTKLDWMFKVNIMHVAQMTKVWTALPWKMLDHASEEPSSCHIC
jgi:hypothetical protein